MKKETIFIIVAIIGAVVLLWIMSRRASGEETTDPGTGGTGGETQDEDLFNITGTSWNGDPRYFAVTFFNQSKGAVENNGVLIENWQLVGEYWYNHGTLNIVQWETFQDQAHNLGY